VEVDDVTISPIERRDDDRSTTDDEPHMADHPRVEDGVDRGVVVRGALRESPDP
jgi:hypothetical protein